MKSAYVIPFTRLPRALRGFDYRIPESIKSLIVPGSVVEIPLRNKKIWGYVEKIHVSSFDNLKPIYKTGNPPSYVSQKNRKLIQWFSEYYFVSQGTAALQWAPFFLKTHIPLCYCESERPKEDSQNGSHAAAQYTLKNDSIEHIEQEITDAASRDGQVLILAPTIAETEQLKKKLEKKYAQSLAIIHSALGAKEFRDNTAKAAQGLASIIVGTRIAIFTPIKNVSTIFITQSDRDEYKQYDANPRYDARCTALQRGTVEGAQIIFSSSALRFEEISAANENGKGIACKIIDLHEDFRNKNFSFISAELQEKIEKTIGNKKTAALILNRTGYSRMVSCATCQYVFSCEQCNSIPRYSSLHASLMCSQCKIASDMPARCPACKGYEYVFPGLGIEKIISYIKKIFGEHAMSSIAVDTAFAFQQKEIPNLGLLGCIAADPVLSLSNFRSSEQQWQSYARCIRLALARHAEVLIQAITPGSVFIKSLAQGDYQSFAKNELAMRKNGNWPPYTRLIKILPTSSHKNNSAALDATFSSIERLKKNPTMPNYTVVPLSKQKRNKQWTEALIKLHIPFEYASPLPPPLREYLKNLPEWLVVDIDPVEL